jgi:tetratricopeptide (TPR) repeat protein
MTKRLLLLSTSIFLAACGAPPRKEGSPPPPTALAAAREKSNDEEKSPLARADALYGQGHLEEAIVEIEKLLHEEPDNARARYFYGCYLAEKGELRGAATELQRTLDMKSPQVPAPIAYTRLGEARERLGEHRAALEAYAKAIEAEREAEQRLLRDKNKSAAVAPTQYAGAPHGSAELYRNLARVCIYLGEIDSALAAIEQARERAPRDAFTENLAVRAYQVLGDQERLADAARRFIEIAGEEPIFQDRVRELREIVRENALPLPAQDKATLVDFVRTAIKPRLPGETPEERFFAEHRSPRLLARDDRAVFVTLIAPDPATPRLRGRGRGKSLAGAIAGAVKQIQDDSRWNPGTIRGCAVRIDIERGSLEPVELTPSQYAPLDGDPVVLSYAARPEVEAGVHGVALRVEDREVYSLPGDAVTEDLPDIKAVLEFACREAGLAKTAWEAAAARVFRFKTETFVSPTPGAAPVELVRGEPFPFPEAAPGAVQDAATLGALWLAQALVIEERPAARPIRERLPSGEVALVHTLTTARFHYEYRARTDKWDDGSYSEVRHAGAAMALVSAYVRTGRVELRDAAELAARWLQDHATWDQGRAAIVVDGRAKLGTQALALCLEDGLAATAQAAPLDPESETERAAYRDGLARTIVACMREDGSFPTYVPAKGAGVPRDNSDSQFFPGEAILSLVRHYKLTNDRRWLDAALKATDSRIKDWRSKPSDPPLDAWLARAITELDELDALSQDPAQADRRAFALDIAHAIVAHQWGPDRGDGAGGLSPPGEIFPRGLATASLGEGLAAVAILAQRRGMPETKDLREATRRLASFALRHQYSNRNAWYLPNPERARGAFRSVLGSARVRIDGVQHNVELMLAVERLLGR